MNGVLIIMSHQNTSWPGVVYNVVWYMICTTKLVAGTIPDQGSFLAYVIFRVILFWVFEEHIGSVPTSVVT